VAQEEEADLIKPYKDGLYENWGVSRQSLDDLYVRFYRVAEWRIGEAAPRGVVSFISNYSWLDGLSHPNMRQRLLKEFDQIWIDNCNGDKYKTGKRTPDGLSDQSMFTTDEHPIGIQVGTAIACLVKTTTDKSTKEAEVYYRDLWGLANEKRSELLRTLRLKKPRAKYVKVKPRNSPRLIFTPSRHQPGYYEWPSLADLTLHQFIGVETCRDEFLIDIDRESLEKRMQAYFDRRVSDERMKEICSAAMHAAPHYKPHEIRARMLKRGFQREQIKAVSYRPFDNRYLYWELEVELLNRRRADFAKHVVWGNTFLMTSNEREKLSGFDRVFFSEFACEKHLLRPDASAIPYLIRVNDLNGNGLHPNFKPEVLERVCEMAGAKAYYRDTDKYSDAATEAAHHLFFHSLAILWSGAYRSENEGGLRQDWPRIPIPRDPMLLSESAKLGEQISNLLVPEKLVPGVTKGAIRTELRGLGNAMKVGRGQIREDDLRVDAGWGFRGQKNAVMCGKGRVEPSAVDRESAVDVFLNSQVYWSNVPNDVWAMTIGGYPVIKKWLSYREFKVLGRPLKLEEVTYITEVIRRLKALLLLGPDLDANYEAVKENALAWQPPHSDG
jgi:predicted helicase